MKIYDHLKDILFMTLLIINIISTWVIVNGILEVVKENSKQIELIINHLNKKEMDL